MRITFATLNPRDPSDGRVVVTTFSATPPHILDASVFDSWQAATDAFRHTLTKACVGCPGVELLVYSDRLEVRL